MACTSINRMGLSLWLKGGSNLGDFIYSWINYKCYEVKDFIEKYAYHTHKGDNTYQIIIPLPFSHS